MRRSRWIGAAVLLAALALGACGGASASGTVATLGDASARDGASSGGTKDIEEAQLAYARCMREQGIDVPDPAPPAGGPSEPVAIEVDDEVDMQAFEAAESKCREHLEGAFPEMSEEENERFMDAALEFARCMRANGVEDHPDPKQSGDRMALEISGDVLEDPDFEEAERKCRNGLPGVTRAPGAP